MVYSTTFLLWLLLSCFYLSPKWRSLNLSHTFKSLTTWKLFSYRKFLYKFTKKSAVKTPVKTLEFLINEYNKHCKVSKLFSISNIFMATFSGLSFITGGIRHCIIRIGLIWKSTKILSLQTFIKLLISFAERLLTPLKYILIAWYFFYQFSLMCEIVLNFML